MKTRAITKGDEYLHSQKLLAKKLLLNTKY